MCVKLSLRDLNINFCLPHTKTYICKVTITLKMCDDIILIILTKAMDISYL